MKTLLFKIIAIAVVCCSLSCNDSSGNVPDNCSNGILDGDELGIDCGGSCPNCEVKLKKAADFPGGKRKYMIGFSIDNKAYVGLGTPDGQSSGFSNEFWRYDPKDDKWTKLKNYSLSTTIGVGVGFEINGSGYIANSYNHNLGVFSPTLKKYNPLSDSWENFTPYPNQYVPSNIAGFKLNNKMYLLNTHNEFISYDPTTQKFEFLEDFPEELNGGEKVFYFAIDNIGYVGNLDGSKNNFYAYSPDTKKWTKRQILDIFAFYPYSFAFKGKGYVGGGWGGSDQKDQFWEYDPLNNKWQRSSLVLDNLKIRTKGLSFYSSNYAFFGLSDNLGDPSTSFFVLQ